MHSFANQSTIDQIMQAGNQPQWADPSMSSAQPQMGGQMGMNAANAHEEALFQPYSTLDEPVLDTIMRDVHAVVAKLKIVMLPLDRTVRIGLFAFILILHCRSSWFLHNDFVVP